MVVLDSFFSFGRQKEWSLVVLDKCLLSYTVTAAWEFACEDSALVILDKCSSYRGGRLNRFDCSNFYCHSKYMMVYSKPSYRGITLFLFN